MRRKKIYCKIHNEQTEPSSDRRKPERILTIWTPEKCLDFRDDPGRQEREVKTNPQPIKESGNLRRKDKPKSAGRNSVKETLDTYAK